MESIGTNARSGVKWARGTQTFVRTNKYITLFITFNIHTDITHSLFATRDIYLYIRSDHIGN